MLSRSLLVLAVPALVLAVPGFGLSEAAAQHRSKTHSGGQHDGGSYGRKPTPNRHSSGGYSVMSAPNGGSLRRALRPSANTAPVAVPNRAGRSAGTATVSIPDVEATASARGTGQLRVRASVPDATLFVNGARVGKLPADAVDLEPGVHEIRVAKYGYRAHEQKLTVEAGKPVDLSVELEPLSID